MSPRVLTLIGNGHQRNPSPTTNLTRGEKNNILHLKKQKQKGRQAEVFCYCTRNIFPGHMYQCLILQNVRQFRWKTLFYYQIQLFFLKIYVFHACPLVHGQTGAALCMKTRSDCRGKGTRATATVDLLATWRHQSSHKKIVFNTVNLLVTDALYITYSRPNL